MISNLNKKNLERIISTNVELNSTEVLDLISLISINAVHSGKTNEFGDFSTTVSGVILPNEFITKSQDFSAVKQNNSFIAGSFGP